MPVLTVPNETETCGEELHDQAIVAMLETTSTRDVLEHASDSIATGVIFALILTVGQRVIGFVRGILFCRLMTDQELGQWSMVWSFLMLLAPLAVLGLPGCLGRYTEYYRHRGHLRTFIVRIAMVSLVMTLVVAAAMLVAPATFSWLIFRDATQITIVVSMAVTLVVVSASNFLSSLLESLRQVKAVTWMRFNTGLLFAAAGIGMIMLMQDRSSAATLGYGVSCLIGSIPAIWFLWKYRSHIADDGDSALPQIDMWKRIAPFAGWLWASNLFHNLFEVSDRYMLIHWSNVSPDHAQGFVGQYHSGRVVPLLLVSIAAVIAGLLMPYTSAAWEAGDRKLACRQMSWSVKLLALLFTAGGIAVLLLAPFLFETVFQGRYNDGLAVLPLTLVYCIWFSLATVGQNYLWVAERGKWAAFAIAAGLVINIVLNILLIPGFGLNGAVVATTLGNALTLLFVYAANHKFGWHLDVGIWITTLLPLVLLLNPIVAGAGSLLFIAMAYFSNGVFGTDEKAEIRELVQRYLKGKVG